MSSEIDEDVVPPLSPRETLPTMYDLPSESPEDGVPDQFHIFQPQLLSETFQPKNIPGDQFFTATDLYLYYDVKHQNWHKRPDWFAVIDVSRLYDDRDLRLSYVVWQEGINPLIVVELLSPGTEKEDLGQTLRRASKPPTKWEVYERILRVPYYIIFDRATDQLRIFKLSGSQYEATELEQGKLWLPDVELFLGLWKGSYQGVDRLWLRWGDKDGNWLPTLADRLEKEKERANAEAHRAERLAAKLRELGVDPEKV